MIARYALLPDCEAAISPASKPAFLPKRQEVFHARRKQSPTVPTLRSQASPSSVRRFPPTGCSVRTTPTAVLQSFHSRRAARPRLHDRISRRQHKRPRNNAPLSQEFRPHGKNIRIHPRIQHGSERKPPVPGHAETGYSQKSTSSSTRCRARIFSGRSTSPCSDA